MIDAAFLGVQTDVVDPLGFSSPLLTTNSPHSEALSSPTVVPVAAATSHSIAIEESSPFLEGLNQTSLDPRHQAWQDAQQHLQTWYASDRWSADLSKTFGVSLETPANTQAAHQLVGQLLEHRPELSPPQSNDLPSIELLPLSQLQARGAYASDTRTIYLAEELLHNPAHPETIAAVLLEELGHFIDHQFNEQQNTSDSPGDEGAIFSALVRNQPLTGAALAAAQLENDHALLRINGQTLTVEQSGLGEFVVDGSGQVEVELVFDGGAYSGQLALFSLSGMETLTPGSTDYIREAARRALSNSAEGYIVASDAEGTRLTGELPGQLIPQGNGSGARRFALTPGDRIAFLFVPNGTVQRAFERPNAGGSQRPLFSIAAANPDGFEQFAQLSEGVLAIEDLRRDRSTDNDFEDFIFAMAGASGRQQAIAELIATDENWLNTPSTELLTGLIPTETETAPPLTPPEPTPVLSETLTQPETAPEEAAPTPAISPDLPGAPILPSLPPQQQDSNVLSDIASSRVVKFYSDFSEAEIAALDGPRLTLGSQTIYVGTQQVTPINQNPIIRSFDSANPANNWTRTDYEITGSDGRAQGLFWSGRDLYAVFTVDGTQGSPDQDFRRAAGDAEQGWLRSYGQGGGGKIAVLGRINPATGELLDAAHLSAILSNGDSNSFTVDDILLNSSGNLVVRATIAFGPRNPDGSRMRQISTGSSPFDYTLEITPDLKRVLNTGADGWVPN